LIGSPAVPPVVVSSTSASYTIVDYPPGSTNRASVSFRATLTNHGSNDIYLAKFPPVALAMSSIAGASSSVTFVTVTPLAYAADTSTSYVIPAGSSRSFNFQGVIDNTTGTSGTKEYKVNAIYYTDNPSIPQKYSITTGLDALRVVVNLSGAQTANRPPYLVSGSGPSQVTVNQSATFNWSASDPDSDNLAWSVNWGDSTGTSGQVCPSSASNTTYSGSHTYAQAGTYTITTTVSDCRGGSAQATTVVNVVALTPAPTPTSISASFNNNSNHPVSLAADGNSSTYYMACTSPSSANNVGTVTYDLGAIKQISNVALEFNGVDADYPGSSPSVYSIQVSSDLRAWTTVSNVTSGAIRTPGTSVSPNMAGRYVRIAYTRVDDGTGWCAAIKEFRVTASTIAEASVDEYSSLASTIVALDKLIPFLLGR
jgi:hypothetical protein